VEIRSSVECVMNIFFFSVAMFCTASRPRHRHVDDQVDLFGVVPAPRDAGAMSGLSWWSPTITLIGLPAPCRRNRPPPSAPRHRAWPSASTPAVHVGENPDLDDVVGDCASAAGEADIATANAASTPSFLAEITTALP